MIERHQDYILLIPSLAPGQSLAGNGVLPLDLDAPFLCRGVGLHIAPPSETRAQTDLNSCLFRFRNQAGADLAQIPVPVPQYFNSALGQGGIYRPVWPQQPYPPGGVIQVDFTNNSADTLTNLQIIFRGVKLFSDGAIPNPTYPARMRGLEFTYQSGKGASEFPEDPQIVLNPTDAIYQRILKINGDADFVLRAGQAGIWANGSPYSLFGYTELYIQLMDANQKPYSNLPIHIDWLFGNAGNTLLPGGPTQLLGNAAPGLIVPEIYMPKNSVLFFDLFRRDAPYVGVTDDLPVRLSLAWIGSKVYA